MSSNSISCNASNHGQWITLYENGRVRVHSQGRTFAYRPKLKTGRDEIRRLIHHLNLVAAGYEGHECNVCNLAVKRDAQ